MYRAIHYHLLYYCTTSRKDQETDRPKYRYMTPHTILLYSNRTPHLPVCPQSAVGTALYFTTEYFVPGTAVV